MASADESDVGKGSNPETSLASNIQIKVAAFDEINVDAWFKIFESKLQLHRILKDASKFHQLMGSLPVSAIIKLPASSTDSCSYIELKTALLETFSKTRPELFEQLLKREKINFEKPSIALVTMMRIGQQVNASEELIRHQFLLSLPNYIRSQLILHIDKTETLAELGRCADLIKSYSRPEENFVQSINSKVPVSHNRSDFHSPSHSNSRRGNKNNSFPNHPANNNRIPFNDENIPFGLRAFNDKQKPRVCRAHIYFGPAAKTCKPWCWMKSHQNVQTIAPNSRSSSPAPNNNSPN